AAMAATFSATTTGIGPDRSPIITATYNGSSASATLTLSAQALVSSLVCTPSTLGPNASSTCTVTLSKAAPEGGASIALSTTNSLLTAPTPLTIASGSNSGPFLLSAGSFTTNQSGSVNAAYNGSSHSEPIALAASMTLSSLVCNPGGLMSAAASTCTATLSQTAPTDTTITLSPSSPLIMTPATLVVPAGTSAQSFTARAGTITADLAGTITATFGASSRTASLTLWSTPTLLSMTCTATKVIVGGSSNCAVTLSKPAGDVVVTISSNNGA